MEELDERDSNFRTAVKLLDGREKSLLEKESKISSIFSESKRRELVIEEKESKLDAESRRIASRASALEKIGSIHLC